MDANFVFGILILLFVALIIGYFLGMYLPVSKPKNSVEELDQNDEGEDKSINSSDWEIYRNADEKSDNLVAKNKNLLQISYDQKTNIISIETKGNAYSLDEIKTKDELNEIRDIITKLQEQLRQKLGIVNELEADNVILEPLKINELSNDLVNPIKSIYEIKSPEKKLAEETTESIPAQIDAILQDQIKDTDLKKFGISLKEIVGKGVAFNVGLDFYNEIDQIPDVEIQNAIRKAVETWEKQQSDS